MKKGRGVSEGREEEIMEKAGGEQRGAVKEKLGQKSDVKNCFVGSTKVTILQICSDKLSQWVISDSD